MTELVGKATAADLASLAEHLDGHFVFGKGRRISLRQRFPSLFAAGAGEGLYLLREGGALASTLACHSFEWATPAGKFRGAMIGLVYTLPMYRRHGCASRLLDATMAVLSARGVDFAVLWTGQPGFYERLGWVLADRGLLGELVLAGGPPAPASDVLSLPAGAGDPDLLEAIRRNCGVPVLPRKGGDYNRLPLPAESVRTLTWNPGPGRAAYALVGKAPAMTILYEMYGTAEGYPMLWRQACQDCERVLVNECDGTPTQRWLAANTDLAWKETPLAMWRALSTRAAKADFGSWYIPYFDRI